MAMTKRQAVEQLAAAHFAEEEFLREILWFHVGEPETLLRLLEVNDASITTNVVVPVLLNRSDDVPYDLMIAEVSSEELNAIRNGIVPLPPEWASVEKAMSFTRGAG